MRAAGLGAALAPKDCGVESSVKALLGAAVLALRRWPKALSNSMTHLPKTISVNGLVKDPHTARIQVSQHVLQSGGFDYVGEHVFGQLLEVLV